MSTPMFERFLSTAEMVDAFDGARVVQAMLDFEAALARAQAAEGVIPAAAAEAIGAACRVDAFDVDAIVEQGAVAGSLAIPLVKRLTAAVGQADPAAAPWVHWGSTSQDVIDTAMALVTRRALGLVDRDLCRLCDALLDLAARHLDTPILARTLMQPAQVASFGFKAVGWAAPLVRVRARLRTAGRAALQLQLGGAVGTLSTLGARGPAVVRRVADALGLAPAPGAWHTQRDTWVSLGCELGVLCGSLGKVGRDVSLLAQGEIGEVAEPAGEGRGGSSAMPNKRNPVASMVALAAALRAPQRVAALLAAMPQEHERGLGNWQAELAEWPGLFLCAHGAVKALADAAAGLEVDAARMRANVDAQNGLVFAEAVGQVVGATIGKTAAHRWLEQLSRRAVAERRHLRDLAREAIAADAGLAAAIDPARVDAVFDVDAAARQAGAVARAQLGALRAQAAASNAAPPEPGPAVPESSNPDHLEPPP